MPLRLPNTLATFMRLMNNVFKPFLGKFGVVFVDDIMIFNRLRDEHEEHLKMLVDILKSLMDIFQKKVEYLGHMVLVEGISMDPKKIKVIKGWKTLSGVHEVRSFHSLAKFYRRFILNCYELVALLTELLKKSKRFKWMEKCQASFDLLE